MPFEEVLDQLVAEDVETSNPILYGRLRDIQSKNNAYKRLTPQQQALIKKIETFPDVHSERRTKSAIENGVTINEAGNKITVPFEAVLDQLLVEGVRTSNPFLYFRLRDIQSNSQ